VNKLQLILMEMWKKWTNQWPCVGSCNVQNACTQQNQFLL